MSELKPCPFCGGKAMLVKSTRATNAFVACDSNDEDCALDGSPVYRATTKEAIVAWNRRSDPNA